MARLTIDEMREKVATVDARREDGSTVRDACKGITDSNSYYSMRGIIAMADKNAAAEANGDGATHGEATEPATTGANEDGEAAEAWRRQAVEFQTAFDKTRAELADARAEADTMRRENAWLKLQLMDFVMSEVAEGNEVVIAPNGIAIGAD